LEFGSWILLQPGCLCIYANAVIQTMREDQHERGCLAEGRVLDGNLTYFSPKERLPGDEERFVLLAMHKLLVERGLCLREHTENSTVLIFPSYCRRDRPESTGHASTLVSYRFNGFLDDIYATLVVRLHHTKTFHQDNLWRYAADFTAGEGKQLGIKLERRTEGAAELVIYADPSIAADEKILFTRYIHEHLLQKGADTVRLRYYSCPHCGTPVGNRETAMKRLHDWLHNKPAEPGPAGKLKSAARNPDGPTILCAECEERVPLWDEFEKFFASDEIKISVRQLQEESARVLSNESKLRALVGDVISAVTLAGQICREFTVSDHGIDMEIEFKNDADQATGRKLYLQMKSGDHHLRECETAGTEVFPIKDERHLHYWMNQAFPVLLVVADSSGCIRWMEIRDWLRKATNNGQKPVTQIEFTGTRFDVLCVRRWRERMLAGAWSEPVVPAPKLNKRDRLAFIEGLVKGRWNDLGVRRRVRAEIASDPDGKFLARMHPVILAAKSRLAGLWESVLTGKSSDQVLPEREDGYPAIRVCSFRLREIGPFADTKEIFLDTGLTVLLGDNATGKSTILRCIALACLGLPAANEILSGAANYLRKGSTEGFIEVMFDLLPDPGSLDIETGHFVVGLKVTSSSQRFEPMRNDEMTLGRPAEGGEPLVNSAIHFGKLRSTMAFGFVGGYGAVRTFAGPQQIFPEAEKPENEWVRSLFSAHAWLVSPEVLTQFIRGDLQSMDKLAAGDLPLPLKSRILESLRSLVPLFKRFSAKENTTSNSTGRLCNSVRSATATGACSQ
jgi:hypothetical protein